MQNSVLWCSAMIEPSPLTKIYIAQEFKKFLRKHAIPYSVSNSSIILSRGVFKPCVLWFQGEYIRVHVINEFEVNFLFPANTLPCLLEKLLRFQVISERELIHLLTT